MTKQTEKHYSPSPKDLNAGWVLMDARDQILGRLASDIAVKLMGKHKAGYVPHMLSGDFVVVVNASGVKLSRDSKAAAKTYWRHSGYPGGKKIISFELMLKNHPERVIEHAVKGMLPKNKIGRHMFGRLKVYAGGEHPHQAQIGANTNG